MDIPAAPTVLPEVAYRRAALTGIHARRAKVVAWRDYPRTSAAYRAYCERVLADIDAILVEFAPIQLPLFAQENAVPTALPEVA